jgi:hypothetical protein
LVGFPEAAAELVEVCIWPLDQMIEQSFNCLYTCMPMLQNDQSKAPLMAQLKKNTVQCTHHDVMRCMGCHLLCSHMEVDQLHAKKDGIMHGG